LCQPWRGGAGFCRYARDKARRPDNGACVLNVPGRDALAELPAAGRRPAPVLTRSEAIPVLRRTIVAPLTRTIREIPTELRLGPEDGLPEECVADFDNLENVSRALLSDPIATLSGPRMHEVCRALAIATGCD
jgi:mRNA interferase MazF